MSNYGSWSVKGIDDRARAIAKEAAHKRGITLGDYINDLLLDGHSEAGPRDEPPYRSPYGERTNRRYEATHSASPLDSLARRIEAVEARSTLAITGIDQSVLGLLARLDNTDSTSAAIAADVERVIDELRETHEALQDKVDQIDKDDTGQQNLQAMKALEQALGKLAAHVHEENGLQHEETMAMKGRIESGFSDLSDRVEGVEVKVQSTLAETAQRVEKAVEQAELRAEGTSRHLSERFSDIESKVAGKLSQVDSVNARLGAVEEDVTGAINSMEGTLLRIQERLNRAEGTTDAALKGLEQSFNHLDARLETVADHASPERGEALRQQFEERFEGLAENLRASIEETRTQLASEIEKAAAGANPELMGRLEAAVGELKERLVNGEERSLSALDDMTEQVNRISTGLDARLMTLENTESEDVLPTVREEMTKLTTGLEERLIHIEQRDDHLIDTVSQKMTDLADSLEERVTKSEEMSAEAIQQVGEQVAGAVSRLQAKQDQQFEAIEDRIETATERNDARLSKALSNVSERLTEMQNKTATVVSPVQKAIASLAARLEDVERFNQPPGIPAHSAALPDMPELVADAGDPIDLSDGPSETQPNAEADVNMHADIDLSGPPGAEPSDLTDGDSDFVAGVEALQTAEPEDDPQLAHDDFAAALEDWEDNSPQADGKEILDTSAPGTTSAEVEAIAADPSEDITPDNPLDPADDWDDARHEARDSDIFADELNLEAGAAEIDDTFGDTVFVKDAREEGNAPGAHTEGAAADLDDIDLDALPETGDALNDIIEGDEDTLAELQKTTDYLSRARQAAISAAESPDALTAPRRKRGKPVARRSLTGNTGPNLGVKAQKPSRLPVFAAASVFALAAAGAGAYITLRGKQPSADQAFAVPTPITPAPEQIAEPEPVSDPAEPSLEGAADTAENEAVDAELFDAEESSLAPTQALNLPIIPAATSLRDAALRGDPVAELKFGEQLLADSDFIKGADFVASAANQGQATAQYSYAKLFEKGLGVPRDLTKAREWTDKAAKGGNVKAMHDLAVFYADGEAGEQSYAAAARWFRAAADYGLMDSQFNLAVLYENGLGISPSQTEALYWYEIAAKGGDAVAPGRIETLRSQMSLEDAQNVQRRANGWQAVQPIPAANGQFTNSTWETGNREQVLALQTVLAGLGYDSGTPDGVPGPSTRTAIRAFQADHGLTTDGEISAELIDKMNAVTQPDT